jgi:hypothetical protein
LGHEEIINERRPLDNRDVIDVEVVNDPDPAAKTAVPAKFAGFFAVEGFIGYLGLNRIALYSRRAEKFGGIGFFARRGAFARIIVS